jgi:hypothetical protein
VSAETAWQPSADVDAQLLLASIGLGGDDLQHADLTPESLTERARASKPTRPGTRRSQPRGESWGLDLYRAHIARHELLSRDEEVSLAKAIEAGVSLIVSGRG